MNWADNLTDNLNSTDNCLTCSQPTKSHVVLIAYDEDAGEMVSVESRAEADGFGAVCHGCYRDHDGDAEAVVRAYNEKLDGVLGTLGVSKKELAKNPDEVESRRYECTECGEVVPAADVDDHADGHGRDVDFDRLVADGGTSPDTDADQRGGPVAMQQIDVTKEPEDMTNPELRAKIAQKAGHKPPRTRLNKKIWNSLHAWFTGEFVIEPAKLKPGFPPRDDVVQPVAYHAKAAHPDESEDNALQEFYDDLTATDPADYPRDLLHDELQALLTAMDECGDQRDWLSKE